MLDLKILYRGPLESCNYGCQYCPFAKKVEGTAALERDRVALERFVSWAAARPAEDSISVLFTPWGEALVRKWYRDALARLTRLPQVKKAAIQTNLSCSLDWVEGCDKEKLAFWATYHPEWTTREKFLGQVRSLVERGVRLSVGMVGFLRFKDEIAAMRAALPAGVYLWINAVKSSWGEEGGSEKEGPPERYSVADLDFLEAIDPLFLLNTVPHPSRGHACRAGASAISVDGDGTMRRCHFIEEPIGNLYQEGFEAALRERACVNDTCGCHIGYVHLDHLGLDKVFGDGILERIPHARRSTLRSYPAVGE